MRDLERGVNVHVADDRIREARNGFRTSLTPEHRGQVEAVSMDMREFYILSTRAHLLVGEAKTVFDKLHAAQNLGSAVDPSRCQEHRARMAFGDLIPKSIKYRWFENPKGRDWSEARVFTLLCELATLVARACAIRDAAMAQWDLLNPGVADRNFAGWHRWAKSSQLLPQRQVVTMVPRHWRNSRAYFTHRITNPGAETINANIQAEERRACGHRNRERLRTAMYFRRGGLAFRPANVVACS